MTAAVEVNECRVYATSQGGDWWTWFTFAHKNNGRITVLKPSLVGALCSVACDDAEHAKWLADHMVENGVPKSAVRVRLT